jgi:hypothetical protein
LIVEVNDAGEILVPAELVQAAPHTRVDAAREGDSVVLKPLTGVAIRKTEPISALPVLEGHLVDPAMTFRREDIYGPDGR